MSVLLGAALALLAPVAVRAAERQSVPVIDTEDATLGTVEVPTGSLHGTASLDVRNGDYARGAYDDDDAGLSRLPVHAAVTLAGVLARDAAGDARLFLIGQSSNGFHAPSPDERVTPRRWYESNTIVALAWQPTKGLTTAAAYAIKASPNGVAGTTHEASLSIRYARARGLGWWRPNLVVTRRTQGDGGVFTLLGLSPEISWGETTVSAPIVAGVGWSGFYGPDSGDRRYASAGLALQRPLGRIATWRAEIVAIARDRRLRRLDAPDGTTAPVVPLATIALSVPW
ncbi:hypothetical protein [Sphingomonas abaci]|uniref:Uncharacterized protein n=1 Tax=Sphingomonas abaci TaxID=237611 RepID=A0A7W7AJZ3_9SPHN|nr:hypothetical protein [Sphingomonas abaci]MBB4618428.1 hypothetical protein [Sphingomonas abaci]